MTIYYTGRGDKGKSEMGAKKIAKDDPVFEALGSLDELNSWLGLCELKTIRVIQDNLFVAQAEIGLKAMGRKSLPRRQAGKIKIKKSHTQYLEQEIAKIDAIVPQIKKFIIPGGSELSAKLDVARAMARRAERDAVRIKASPELLQYLNRLSSLLFALARLANYRLKKKEQNPSYR